MATVTSLASGNWSADAATVWSTGVVPTTADDVTIGSGHAIALDTTGLVASTVTVASGGSLTEHASASSELVTQTGITVNSGGTIDIDVSASVSQTVSLKFNGANVGDVTPLGGLSVRNGGNVNLVGFSRKRATTINSALVANTTMSVVVADATGWQVGDTLVFISTSAHVVAGPQKTDLVTIATITPGAGTTATVTWTDGVGTGGAVLYAHAADSYVGNFTSNLNYGPAVTGYYVCGWLELTTTYTLCTRNVRNVAFNYIKAIAGRPTGGFSGYGGFVISGESNQPTFFPNRWDTGEFSDNAFYDVRSGGLCLLSVARPITRKNNIFWGPNSYSGWAISRQQSCGGLGTEEDIVIFDSNGLGYCDSAGGSAAGVKVLRPVISCKGYAFAPVGFNNETWNAVFLQSNWMGFYGSGTYVHHAGKFGKAFGADNLSSNGWGISNGSVLFDNCDIQSNAGFDTSYTYSAEGSQFLFESKNGDIESQELYFPYGSILRENTETVYSTSSLVFIPRETGRSNEYSVTIPIKAGETIRLVGQFKASTIFYNSGLWTPPTLTLSGTVAGVALTPSVFTASSASDAAWEKINDGTTNKYLAITNSESVPGMVQAVFLVESAELTFTGSIQVSYPGSVVTLTRTVGRWDTDGFKVGDSIVCSGFANSNNNVPRNIATMAGDGLSMTTSGTHTVETAASATALRKQAVSTAKCYFEGIPTNNGFVQLARHYGYVFDQASPNVTRNETVTASGTGDDFSSSQTTAYAITGVTVTGSAAQSDVSVGANRTFQETYDYTQAWSCVNLTYAVPFSGSGDNGSPALAALCDVDIVTGYKINGSGSLSMGAFTLTAELNVGGAYTYTGGTYSRLTTLDTFDGGTLNIGAAGTYTFAATSPIISMTPTAPGTYVMGAATFGGTVDLRNTTAHDITVEVPAGTTTTILNSPGAGVITVSSPQIYQSVTITGGTAGTRLQIYDTTNTTELYNDIPGSWPHTWTDGTPAAGDRDIRVRASYVSGAIAKEFIEATAGTCGTTEPSNAITYPIAQVADSTYDDNAVDGSAVTGVTFTDASPDVVNIDVAANTISWKTIYAAWVYYAFTETGIATDIDYIDGIDTANYILSNMQIKNTSSPTAPLVVSGGYGRDATTGASVDLVDTTGGTLIFAPDHVVSYAVGSGVTSQDKTDIATAVLSAASASPIHADAKKMNAATVYGTGTPADLWRGVA